MTTVSSLVFTINQLLPEPHAGLVAGILFGTKATLSPLLKESLITTSTLHIVALSGMNITILEGMIAAFLVPIVGRRISAFLTISGIVGFVWFVGVSPSIVRAAIMGSISLMALLFGRQAWSLLSLIIASGVMLLIAPHWIGELSFQLSALATLGIILFGQQVESREGLMQNRQPARHRLRLGVAGGDPVFRSIVSVTEFKVAWHALFHYLYSLIKDDLRITLAAQVFTIPLIFYTFHRVSLISPISNILIGFIIAPLTAIGLLMVGVGSVWLPLAIPFSWVVWVMAQYILWVVTWTARIPFASLGF